MASFKENNAGDAQHISPANSFGKMIFKKVRSIAREDLVKNFIESKTLHDLLCRVVAVCGVNSIEKDTLLSCIASLSDPLIVRHLLSMCAKEAETVGKYSYQHVNGFYKFVLAKHEGFVLRLHHFCKRGKEDVHNHRWDFVSSMLAGKYTHTMYDEGDRIIVPPASNGETIAPIINPENELYHYQKNIYKPTLLPDGSKEYQLEYQYDCNLKFKSIKEFPSFSCYYIDKSLMHAVISEEGNPSVTLVITLPTSSPTNLQFVKSGVVQETVVHPAALSKTEVKLQLEVIAKLIEKSMSEAASKLNDNGPASFERSQVSSFATPEIFDNSASAYTLAGVTGASMSLLTLPANSVTAACKHVYSDKLFFISYGKGLMWIRDFRSLAPVDEEVRLAFGVSVAIHAGVGYQIKTFDELWYTVTTIPPMQIRHDDVIPIEGKFPVTQEEEELVKSFTPGGPLAPSPVEAKLFQRTKSENYARIIKREHLDFHRVWIGRRGDVDFPPGGYRAFFTASQLSDSIGKNDLLHEGNPVNECANGVKCVYSSSCKFIHLCVEGSWWKHPKAIYCNQERCKHASPDTVCGLAHSIQEWCLYPEQLRSHHFNHFVDLCRLRYGSDDLTQLKLNVIFVDSFTSQNSIIPFAYSNLYLTQGLVDAVYQESTSPQKCCDRFCSRDTVAGREFVVNHCTDDLKCSFIHPVRNDTK